VNANTSLELGGLGRARNARSRTRLQALRSRLQALWAERVDPSPRHSQGMRGRPPRLKGWVLVVVVAATLLGSRQAAATSGFPNQIKSELSMPSVPSCALCHATPAGGGPVTQPFGQSMVARGLRAGDGASLSTALQALEAEGTDSDGDGLGDIEELRMGLDPNFSGDANSVPPQYGCGARVAAHAPVGSSSVVAGLFIALALLTRRRRSKRWRF